MINNKTAPTSEQFRIAITPLVNKSLKSLILFAVAINALLLCLALSKIVFYAKIMVLGIIIMCTAIIYFRYRSGKSRFQRAISYEPQMCEVIFKLESIGDGQMMVVNINLNGTTYNKSCNVQNISTSLLNQSFPAYVFIQNEIPELIITEDLLHFAIIA
jgi:hypothetical protein